MSDPSALSAGDGPRPSREDWLGLVDRVLEGRGVDRLVSRSEHGLRIEPIYERARDAKPLVSRPAGAAWTIVQRLDHPGAADANRQALDDLENGATGLALVFDAAPSAHGFGLAVDDLGGLRHVLEGVDLGRAEFFLEAGKDGFGAIALLAACCDERGIDFSEVQGSLGLDPLGTSAARGELQAPAEDIGRRCADAVRALLERGFTGHVFLADGRPYHAAGCTAPMELAVVLATAVAYLRALDAQGLPVQASVGRIAFKLVATTDEIVTTAKLRAARLLWARVAEEIGMPGAAMRMEAQTSWRELTRYDPWTNLLRGTIAALSAVTAGVDALTVLPFTQARGLPDPFARRLARNTQLVLLAESHVHRVGDPAAGSGAFESVTEHLAELAWDIFREIEAAGGIEEALRSGLLHDRISLSRSEQERLVATGGLALVGASAFADMGEPDVAVLAGPPASGRPRRRDLTLAPPRDGGWFEELTRLAREGAILSELTSAGGERESAPLPALPNSRLAEPFERFRARAEIERKRQGRLPQVFLAHIGAQAAHAGRSGLAAGLFASGGIEVLDADGLESGEAAAAAFESTGAKIAGICSSDPLYEAQGEEFARCLSRAGASRLYAVSPPESLRDRLTAAGVSDYIDQGCDMLQVLGRAWAALSVD